MAKITRLNPEGIAKPFANYSHVVTAEGAQKLVFCAGQVAADADGKVLPPDDFDAQAKMVMENLTKALAAQYGKHNISFCAVNPGPVRTERWAGLVNAMARDMKLSHEEADRLAPSSIPVGRIAEVDEVAALVVMLASPLMHMVNGTQIEIDGGQEKALMDRLRDRR